MENHFCSPNLSRSPNLVASSAHHQSLKYLTPPLPKLQEEKMLALKQAMETGDTSVMDKEEENEEDLLLKGADGIELDEADIAELKRMQLEIKEKKFTTKRNSAASHHPINRIRRVWQSAWLASGWGYSNNPFDQVLPWMFVGRGFLAKNVNFLEKHGFTHILNLTTDIPNSHPSKFVYKRIPIDDKDTEDASLHFRTIIDFIRRVALCRGKIYIHCSVGASRAPMAIMLYFVVVRKISLVDIYQYLQAVRPVVGPNKHFLFQLSEMEVSSVSVLCVLCVLCCVPRHLCWYDTLSLIPLSLKTLPSTSVCSCLVCSCLSFRCTKGRALPCCTTRTGGTTSTTSSERTTWSGGSQKVS